MTFTEFVTPDTGRRPVTHEVEIDGDRYVFKTPTGHDWTRLGGWRRHVGDPSVPEAEIEIIRVLLITIMRAGGATSEARQSLARATIMEIPAAHRAVLRAKALDLLDLGGK